MNDREKKKRNDALRCGRVIQFLPPLFFAGGTTSTHHQQNQQKLRQQHQHYQQQQQHRLSRTPDGTLTTDGASPPPPSSPLPQPPLFDGYEEGKLQLATIPRLQLKGACSRTHCNLECKAYDTKIIWPYNHYAKVWWRRFFQTSAISIRRVQSFQKWHQKIQF